MDWLNESKLLFSVSKPLHFTQYDHCEECLEHDETLRNNSLESISTKELGNPGWDPLCFCTAEGMEYYFPALVRISLETAETQEFYFEQLLFHLSYDNDHNRFLLHCNKKQKEFIASFIQYIIETYPAQLENEFCSDEALSTYELWNNA